MLARECIICLEEEIRKINKITSKCFHEKVVCLECINKYIDTNIDKFVYISQFDQNAKIKITCPIPICNKLMERSDIKKIATKDIYERYDFLTFKLAIQKTPGFRWCQASCGSGQIHIGKGTVYLLKSLIISINLQFYAFSFFFRSDFHLQRL
jgi:E3 ubiquitin-protein ligase RNF144